MSQERTKIDAHPNRDRVRRCHWNAPSIGLSLAGWHILWPAIFLGSLITLLAYSDAKPTALEVKESEGERETAGKTAQSPHPESGGPKPATDKRLEDMSVAELVAMLRSENPQRRAEAARRLGELGPQAAAARPVLVELLDDPHEAVVVCAAQALASIEKPGPDLIAKAIEKLRSIDENAIPRMPTIVALGPNFSGWEYSILQLLAAAGVSAVNPLKACLQNEEWLVRAGAARALGAIGPDADSAVPALAAMVNDPQLLVRCGALLALGQIGSSTEITVPLLKDSLRNAEPLIRAHAAAGLGELGAAAEPAVLELVTLTKDPNVFVRRAAGRALVNLGPHAKSALPDLISRLRNCNSYLGSHKSGYFRLAGGDAYLKIDGFPEVLQAIGPAAVPLLMEALRDESLHARSKAAEILGRMGRDAEPAIDQLVDALNHAVPGTTDPFADALIAIGPVSVPALTAVLQDPAPAARARAIGVLARIRPLPDDIGSTLLQMVDDERVRIAAVSAMGDLEGPAAAEVLPTLARLSQEPNELGTVAVSALGRLGPVAVPALLQTSRGTDGFALMGKRGVPILAQALKNDDPIVRRRAANALERIGRDAVGAVPVLLARIADSGEDHRVVEAAKQAVIRIDEGAALGLADALTSTSERARRFAAQRLAAIGAPISPVHSRPLNILKGALTSYEALTTPGAEPFDKLRAALSSEDEQVRIAAAVILGKVTTAPPECVPLLIKALDDPTLQRSAVLALGKMGPEAKDAVPALQKLSAARSLNDRTAAREALKRITGDH